jgi:hypothetical protein
MKTTTFKFMLALALGTTLVTLAGVGTKPIQELQLKRSLPN